MSSAQNVCPWCGRSITPEMSACAACGAPVNEPLEVDAGGWTVMPGARDMAQLEVGKSRVQISGQYVPVADFQLAAQESVYFTHHVVLWRDPSVQVRARSLKGGWKRLLAGMPLVMAEAEG